MQHQKPPDPPTRHPQGEGGNHIHYLIPPTYIVRDKKYIAMTPQLQIYLCYIDIYIYIYTFICLMCTITIVHIYICIYIYMYIYMFIYMYIYICIYICIHIFTYIYIYMHYNIKYAHMCTTFEHIKYIRTTYSLSTCIYEYMYI